MERVLTVTMPKGVYSNYALAVATAILVASFGCGAGIKNARHGATVTVVGAHATLSAIQDTEETLVCGAPKAPPAGSCVTPELHTEIRKQLATAFRLDGELAATVRAMPTGEGTPTPPQVLELLVRIQALVTDIMNLIPEGAPKERLGTLISEMRRDQLKQYPVAELWELPGLTA